MWCDLMCIHIRMFIAYIVECMHIHTHIRHLTFSFSGPLTQQALNMFMAH